MAIKSLDDIRQQALSQYIDSDQLTRDLFDYFLNSAGEIAEKLSGMLYYLDFENSRTSAQLDVTGEIVGVKRPRGSLEPGEKIFGWVLNEISSNPGAEWFNSLPVVDSSIYPDGLAGWPNYTVDTSSGSNWFDHLTDITFTTVAQWVLSSIFNEIGSLVSDEAYTAIIKATAFFNFSVLTFDDYLKYFELLLNKQPFIYQADPDTQDEFDNGLAFVFDVPLGLFEKALVIRTPLAAPVRLVFAEDSVGRFFERSA